MKKYIKDGKMIFATEKAYKVLYKEMGYVPYKEKTNKKENKKDSEVNEENNIETSEKEENSIDNTEETTNE